MKLKKRIVLFLLAGIILYLVIGAILLYNETIQRLYIFPGWSIKHGATDEDESTVSSDGPIIMDENGKTIKYQVIPKGTQFSVVKSEIIKQDSLNCYIDETKDTFAFKLKDALHFQPSEYKLPGKMLVISDIEGNFKGFKSILQGNKIINQHFNWTFGTNHLVLVGDFFDRGLNVSECLWLIYKLENEAERQGGKVHFILGNHEMLNLKGEMKYVRDKYYENANTLKLGYEKWYAQHSELGKWLRTKNGIEKIGDLLFVHAGISKDFPKNYTLQQINENIRKGIDRKFQKEEAHRNDIFIGKNGPLWYRGIANEDEKQEDIDETLKYFKAGKMIIGHTIMDEIGYLYNQKVIAIDLDHQSNSENGKMHALWIEKEQFFITDNRGVRVKLKP